MTLTRTARRQVLANANWKCQLRYHGCRKVAQLVLQTSRPSVAGLLLAAVCWPCHRGYHARQRARAAVTKTTHDPQLTIDGS